MINVLMISTDTKILEEGSSVRARMIEYGTLFKELHIVLFSTDIKAPVEVLLSNNVHVYPTRSFSKLVYIKDAVKIGKKVIKEKNLLVGESVITTQDPFETGMVGRMLSKKSGIPLHVQIHTDFQSIYFKKSGLNKIRIALSKMVLPHAQAVRAVSERIVHTLPLDIQKRAAVLPIFVDISTIKNSSISIDLKKKYPQFKKIILIASRLTKEKDVVTALEAFGQVVKKHPGIGLVIVGDGPEKSHLEACVAKYEKSVKESIVFEFWMNHDAVISCMKTCDIFLSTSLYEGYGLSMLEAYIAGATVVATDAGIAPLLVSEEYLVSSGDKSRMVSTLDAALSGKLLNKLYIYPYDSREVYMDIYRADIERACTRLKS